MRLPLAATLTALPVFAYAEPPKVVTDIAPVHSLVAQVMAGVGDPDVLVAGGASPHDFQFGFDQAASLQNADLVIWVGPALTPWLDEAVSTLGGDVSQLVLLEAEGWEPLMLRTDAAFDDGHDHGSHGHGHDDHDEHSEHGHDDHGHDDHEEKHDHDEHDHGDHDEHEEHGDHDDHGHEDHDDHAHEDDHKDEARVDPHAWLDPQVAQDWVVIIAEDLAAIDPENAALYGANAVAAVADLQALEAEITATLADVPAGSLVVPHDAYQYFGARFDRPALAAIALDDASIPGPDRIAELQDRVTADDVDCVLSDNQTRAEWSDLIRENTDAGTAVADPMGGAFEVGPAHYRATLTALAASYAACLNE
ncbi:zinc ABC transporter substrate-binding protein [Pseudooctadecabacter jejudonensis]|uniref:High-affinity zinc uptake system protein ZnuA n=1 Tax=Pseudooctadecabacter jejudonensis TaxID=1391910 RepID=A0A1Y5RUX7_9RHOB|nr:zinc ABC transporter substrate-binding protein [Pseudooctadecabacter jejudonensis]SLN23144.1 High-affinity zinc uptake system protein ZnuA precursor [Pseudooctadecabacter jejudonensis]